MNEREFIARCARFLQRYDLPRLVELAARDKAHPPRRMVVDPDVLRKQIDPDILIGADGSTPLALLDLPVWCSRYIEHADVLVDTSRAPLAEEVEALINYGRGGYKHYDPPTDYELPTYQPPLSLDGTDVDALASAKPD